MKFAAGIVLAAVAVAGVSAESTNTLTVDPKSLSRVDPKALEGLGPQTPAGDNPKLKKAMESLEGSSSGSYYTIDPRTLPTENPAYIGGLGPQVPIENHRQLKESDTNTLTINPASLPTENPAYLEGLGPQTPAGDNPKLKKAMDDLTSKEGGSSNTLTIDPNTLSRVDPKTLTGLGPVILPGMRGYGQNAQFNKAWKEFLDKEGASPQVPIENRQLKESETTNTLTINPASLPTENPAYLEGLGPQTPAGDNPKIKKAMDDLATKSGSTNTLDIPATPGPTLNPAMYEGLGPVVLPGMPGYGQNAQFNKAWKEFLAKEGASQSGSTASNCAQVCPDEYDPVCGSDGVTYSNSCFLGIASCQNPDKHITQASHDACSKQTTQVTN